MVFPGIEESTDKPEGLCEAIEAFLDAPTIDGGHRLVKMVEDYKVYPLPPEGLKERINKESILNLEEW